MTDETRAERSARYRAELKNRSLDRFSGAQCIVSGHQFIVDDVTAEKMADALATKNPALMKRAVGDGIEKASVEALESPIDTFTGEWNEVLSKVFERDITLHELIITADTETIRLLRESLQSSRTHQFDLEIDSYMRLLHTIAMCTIPDDGFSARHASNQRLRSKDSHVGLFSLSTNILDSYASQEPGIGMLRNGVLNGDADSNPVDRYLSRLQKSETAKNALSSIVELVDPAKIQDARSKIIASLENEDTTEDTDEDLKLHLLTWEILPHKFDDPDGIKAILKKRAKKLAVTAKARARFEQCWDETRLDTLFSIARQEAHKGRTVEIYISSAFNNSQEFYVAVELNHPDATDKNITIADNPMDGNAIYMVDELHTLLDDTGNNYGWKKVLGASKKIARHRGARRRFHVGEWEKLTEQFCIHGVGEAARKAAIEVVTQQELIDYSLVQESVAASDAEEQSDSSEQNINTVLQNIDAMRRQIDEIYKRIIDKNE